MDDNIGSGSGSGGTSIDIDTALSDTSENPVQNKVVKAALDGKANAGDIPDVSGFALVSDIPDVSGLASMSDLDSKQDVLTFDGEPTENSANPVTSGGVYAALQNLSGYELPIATASILGGIKVGAGLEIDASGILRVVGFQTLPGYVSLSESSVVLNYTATTKTISVLGSSGQITSVVSANENYATVTFSNGIITVEAGESGGETTIDIAVAENPPNYDANIIRIPVVVDKTKIVTWADGTDEEIAAMLTAHEQGKINIYDHWNLGDCRTVSLSAMDAIGVRESHVAQDVELMLVDKDVVDLSSGRKCTFVWQQRNLLQTSGSMTATATSTNAGGWRDCARRTWCNDVYYNALPSEFRSMIKEASIKTYAGGGAVETEQYITSDKIFLPCTYNVAGNKGNSADGEDTVYWDFYKQNNAYKKKSQNIGGTWYVRDWWLRSPRMSSSTNFCYIATNGTQQVTSASTALGIAPCGCI